MARLNIESQAAPAVQGPLENQVQTVAALLLATSATAAALYPGVLIGAALAAVWRWRRRPPLSQQIACAIIAVLPLLALWPQLQTAWLWRDMLANALPDSIRGVDASLVARSVAIEALAGPAALQLGLLASRLLGRTVGAQVRRDHRLDQQRWRAISGEQQLVARLRAMAANPNIATGGPSPAHPIGTIRLGLDRETNRPFDLKLPDDIAYHVFLPGASGTGKTTTLRRLADGALANGWGVVFVDCKAGNLRYAAERLADRYGLAFNLVDPDDPATLGYDPCIGDPSAVANKLVGAFSYGPNAEIYKNIAMEAVPLVVRALQALGEDVTLEAINAAFNTGGLRRLADQLDDSEARVRSRLLALNTDERVIKDGYVGMRSRIGALLEGKFGDVFRNEAALDWQAALAAPSVTYIALSALAADSDVELMGRVIAQDLKQQCAARIRDRQQRQVCPVLAVFDEFAALREAEQLNDLLLQAREALMPTVIATQSIPLAPNLSRAALNAGLMICHRIESGDAQALADQFGTRTKNEVTQQIDWKTGFSEKGSARRVDAFNVHPNELRTFGIGVTAVKSTIQGRYSIVEIYPDT